SVRRHCRSRGYRCSCTRLRHELLQPLRFVPQPCRILRRAVEERLVELEPTGQMKIGVIGAGAVGSACLLSSILRGIAREIVVVNRDRKRAKAVVTDLQYGAALVFTGKSFPRSSGRYRKRSSSS